MRDRRQHQRRKVYFGGRLIFNHRQSVMNCTVRSFGTAGAKVVVEPGAVLPDEFELEIDRLRQSFRTRIAWREADGLGLRIVHAPAQAEIVPLDLARKLRRLEAENRRLQRRVSELSSDQ